MKDLGIVDRRQRPNGSGFFLLSFLLGFPRLRSAKTNEENRLNDCHRHRSLLKFTNLTTVLDGLRRSTTTSGFQAC